MRVSVVVPLFNKAGYVERTLRSIAAQTLSDIEVIVVDDGSTDGGDQVVARFPDSRVRLIRQTNAGPGAARNRGMAEARAEYVAFIDGDDTWLPTFLEIGVGLLDSHTSVACVSTAWFDLPAAISSAPVWSARGISEGVHHVGPETPDSLLDAMVTFMTASTTMGRTSIMRRFGGFEEGGCRFGEDGMLWLKLLLNHPVAFHLHPLAEIHRDASGLSGNYKAARPIEPYLSAPDALLPYCPAELRPLLKRVYARRACKTACMLAYWGHWRQARQLLRQFVTMDDWRAPLFGVAFAVSTPLGPLAGTLHRVLKPARRA